MNESRGWTLFAAFGLCSVISVLIVIHSYEYTKNFFPPYVALMFATVVEIAYVSLAALGILSGSWKSPDKILKGMLFFLSVVPASLETSEKIRELTFESVFAAAPAEPLEPTSRVRILESGIRALDDEIAALRDFKSSYDLKADSRTWYAFQDQKRIDALLAKREELSAEIRSLEAEYAKNYEAYRHSLQRFQSESKTDEWQNLFNFFFLAWALSIIWVLQLINGRLSGKAASLLKNETSSLLFPLPDLPYQTFSMLERESSEESVKQKEGARNDEKKN